jgi:hypothetical protein
MGDKRGAYRVLVGRLEGNRPLGRPGVDWRIILKSFFKKLDGEPWTGLIGLVIRTRGELM